MMDNIRQPQTITLQHEKAYQIKPKRLLEGLRLRVLRRGVAIGWGCTDWWSVVVKSGSPATSPTPPSGLIDSALSAGVDGTNKRRKRLFRHKTLSLANFMRYEQYCPIATITPTRSHNFMSGSRTLTDTPMDSGGRGRDRAS